VDLVQVSIIGALALVWIFWGLAVCSWLDRPAWQRALIVVSVPLSWSAVVLGVKGDAYAATGLLILVPIACFLGLIFAGIGRIEGGSKEAAGRVAVGTVLLVGFINPWTLEAVVDGLFYKRSLSSRDVVVKAAGGSSSTLRVPLAYIADQDYRLYGESKDFMFRILRLRLEVDSRDFRPWAGDLWQRLGSGDVRIDGSARVRVEIATAGCVDPKFNDLGCDRGRDHGKTLEALAANKRWATDCGDFYEGRTWCRRWRTSHMPVRYRYSVPDRAGLTFDRLDIEIENLLRSFGVPVPD
jgi:hypothetical protein